MKKSIFNFSISKSALPSILFGRQFYFSMAFKNFSSSDHGHGHGNAESDYHERKYNRISYNRKLAGPEREKIAFIDFLNDKDTPWLNPRRNINFEPKRYEVLAPFATRREDMEDSLMDRTEIQARIYNLFRELDLKPLDQIDFDADYEKDLGFDSLEWTAIVTSIEHEFHTVFEDSLFDHFRTINEFVKLLENDFSCF